MNTGNGRSFPFSQDKNEIKKKSNSKIAEWYVCAPCKCERSSKSKETITCMHEHSSRRTLCVCMCVRNYFNYSQARYRRKLHQFRSKNDREMRILCMRNYGNMKPVTMLFSNQVKIMRWLFANKTSCKRSLLPFKEV